MSRASRSATSSVRALLRGTMWRFFFGIAEREVDMEQRGFFTGVPGMRMRLEACGRAFTTGYHLALRDAGLTALAAGLEAVPRDICGFAYEGAAMGLALLDRMTPWNRQRFAEEAAALTDTCLDDLDPATDSIPPAYEIWRRRIQHHFSPVLIP